MHICLITQTTPTAYNNIFICHYFGVLIRNIRSDYVHRIAFFFFKLINYAITAQPKSLKKIVNNIAFRNFVAIKCVYITEKTFRIYFQNSDF